MINPEPGNKNIIKAYSMLLYFAGSFILNEPAEECIQDMANNDLFKKMPLKSKNPNYTLASSFLRNINKEQKIDYDLIIADYLTLFDSSGIALAPPFESYYPIDVSTENQKIIPAVHSTYISYGWQPDKAESVPDDHLGVEIQFLNLMLEKYNEIEDSICRKELINDIKKFIDTHLSHWLSTWNKLMQKHASSDFYKGISYLVLACVQDINNLF